MEKIVASDATQMHRSSQEQARLRLEDHQALGDLFRALDSNDTGFIEPEDFEWMLNAIRHNSPAPESGTPILESAYYKRGTRKFRRVLREFDATVYGRITISGLRTWWESVGCSSQGVASRVLRRSTEHTGAGSAKQFVAQTLGYMRRQSQIEGATTIQSHVRRFQSQKRCHAKKAANRLPGSRRVAALRIQTFYRMRLARVRDCFQPFWYFGFACV